MALLMVGRRLPVMRYLSALASHRNDTVLGAYTSGINQYSAASGPDSTPSRSGVKDEPGKPSSESPAAPTSTDAATNAHPSEAATSLTSTSQPATVEDDEEWTEVVHSSGQLYYWNQRTGETTQLGEPKPKSNRGSSGSSGSGADGGDDSEGRGGAGGGANAGGHGHMHDPRAEAHLEDRTGTYASMGVLIGAFLGWVSQFV